MSFYIAGGTCTIVQTSDWPSIDDQNFFSTYHLAQWNGINDPQMQVIIL